MTVFAEPQIQRDLDAFITKAVAKARTVAGRQVDSEDLEQTARLAVLEAQHSTGGTGRGRDLKYLSRRVTKALKAEIRPFVSTRVGSVSLDGLIAEDDEAEDVETVAPALSLVTDTEAMDEVVYQGELAEHVNLIIEGMPEETAQVVRLCFGLEGDEPVAPIDVADILDEEPEVILGHLWAAEKLFRHFSSEGKHRRLTRMTQHEYLAFSRVGDLAWYDMRDLNLNNADLRPCDLSHAVLSGMNLWGLNLAGGQARNANLFGAMLEGANLAEADLTEINLERAGLRNADLRAATLSNATLWGADLGSVTADHADFSGCDLRSAQLQGADLTRANLTNADLRGADLRGCKLVGAELMGANLQGADLTGADFRWADLRGSDLCWSNLSAADARGASLEGAIRSPKLTSIMATGRAPRPQRPLSA
jgi:uncharacterized protein YjbI with pentapeptide repeats/DNA-directed RNA polymerase specialized sigma24 family protein